MVRLGVMVLAMAVTMPGMGQAARQDGWTVVGPGGGGTTIGPVISPHDPHLVVERCDMTGGYVTRDDGRSWRMFNLRGVIQAFAFDPVNPHVIYAGNAALWKSSDDGESWRMVFPDPARGTVEHQLGDHADYSLTSKDGAYPGGSITALLVDPKNAKALVAAFRTEGGRGQTEGGKAEVVASRDGGATWKKLGSLPDSVLLLTMEGRQVVAVAGSAAYGLGAEGGVTERGRLPGAVFSASAGTRGGKAWIYATTKAGGMFASTDGGRQWAAVVPSLGMTEGRYEAVATSSLDPRMVYAGFRDAKFAGGDGHLVNGIVTSADGGKSWRIVFREARLPATNLKGSWVEQRARHDSSDIFFDSPYSLSVAPTDARVVYATDLFRTYRTLDGGTSWEEMNSRQVGALTWISRGLDVTNSYGVQFDPFDSQHVFMDNTDIGLFQSTDGGRSWKGSSEGVPGEWRNTTYWVVFDPKERGKRWGAFSGVHDLPRAKMWRHTSPLKFTGGVGVSTDGGMHWKASNAGMPEDSVTHLLLDPESPVGRRTLYACAFGRGVYKSVDGGRTWVLKNVGIEGAEPFAWRMTRSQDGSLYLVVARRSEKGVTDPKLDGAVYRSTDGAEHWVRMELPKGVTGPTGLAVGPATGSGDAQRLYLTAWGIEGESADHGGGVYGSEDGGRSWKPLLTRSQHVYDVTLDPKRPGTMYVSGFDAAAYRSTDGGVHWEQIKGFDFKWGHRVFLDPNHAGEIYITTFGGGVWHGPDRVGAGNEDLTPVPVAMK